MKHLFLFGLLLSLPFFGFSQGEWNKWYFGQYAGLDFSSGAPVSINGNAMLAPNATITVSDSLGNLLFYSHGYRVWNRNNVIMSNSFLYGDPNLDQPVFCVKSISNDSIFYIISVQDSNWAFTHPPGIFYSILNMHLDGGLGNIPLGENNHPFPNARHATSKLTGTRHQNNKDAWIVVRDDSIAGYRSYKITSSGVDIIPVLSLAHAQSPAWCGGNWGDLKISQDGKKIIATYPVDNIAEYCTFNNQTGNVTSLFRFRLPKYLNEDYYPDYCEFSRKANRVYVYGKSYNGNWGALYQYDANLTDSAQFKQSEQLIYFFSPSQIMNGMQLGKDGKIYVSQNYTGSVGVINFPENSGPACGFQYDAIPLNGNLSLEGLPQFLQKYKAYVTHNGNCPNKDIGFTSDIWPPADSIRWNFGDPSSGPFNISTLANPVHSFSSSGNFTVELYVRHNDNRTDTTWHLVTILPAPQPVLGPDRTICNGDSVKLDAGSWMGATYSWDNLATSQYGIGSSQTYTAKADGNYRVTVTGTNGCSGKDTVLVTVNPNLPVSITVSSSQNPVCAGTAVTFTATPINGGTSPSFLWYINNNPVGANSPIFTYVPINGDLVKCSLTSSDPCTSGNPASSSQLQMIVDNVLLVSVSVSASANNVCAGTSVTFTATPTNPGTTPLYQWKVNGGNVGTNSPIYTYVPAVGDIVSCTLTSSLPCTSGNPATSNPQPVTVNPNLPVSVSVSASANPVCTGTSVTFTAAPTNGGNTPSYQWKVNGGNVGINSPVYTYIPVNGDIVSCVLTSSETCTSNNPASSIQYPVT
ncbi:MAG: PKD domain-containing protein, partial [Bacteroidetes bacterium]|nr:PKD domain-containing protein [Bacteroidota bacterium]